VQNMENFRVEPPRKLSRREQRTWDAVYASGDHPHLHEGHGYLVASYCALCELFEKAVTAGDVDRMDRTGRLCLSYATRLKITMQSRIRAEDAAVAARRGLERAAAVSTRLFGGSTWEHLE